MRCGGVAVHGVLSGEREVEANPGRRSRCSWHVVKNARRNYSRNNIKMDFLDGSKRGCVVVAPLRVA